MKFFFCIVGFFGFVFVHAGNADDVLGTWFTADDDSKIEIFSCDEGRYCGKIIWIKDPNYPEDDPGGMPGQVRVDRENPKKKFRDRPLLGMQIMERFKFENDQWVGGTIYDPENGKTYKCKMKFNEDGHLEVRGYVGLPVLGRTEVWRRAD